MAQFDTRCIKRDRPKPACFGLNLIGRHKIEFRILINMILYEPWTCYTINFYMFTRNPLHGGPPPTQILDFYCAVRVVGNDAHPGGKPSPESLRPAKGQ